MSYDEEVQNEEARDLMNLGLLNLNNICMSGMRTVLEADKYWTTVLSSENVALQVHCLTKSEELLLEARACTAEYVEALPDPNKLAIFLQNTKGNPAAVQRLNTLARRAYEIMEGIDEMLGRCEDMRNALIGQSDKKAKRFNLLTTGSNLTSKMSAFFCAITRINIRCS